MYIGILSIIIIFIIGLALLAFTIQHLRNVIGREFKYHFEAFKFKTIKTGEIIPLLEHDFSKSGMPIIEVKIQGKPHKFMLDSGANINVLDKAAFDALDDSSIEKLESKGFTTASGDSTDDVFKANIDFKHKQRKFNETFEILDMSGPFGSIAAKDGVTIQGILGSHFFKTHRWTIDFENLIVWTK